MKENQVEQQLPILISRQCPEKTQDPCRPQHLAHCCGLSLGKQGNPTDKMDFLFNHSQITRSTSQEKWGNQRNSTEDRWVVVKSAGKSFRRAVLSVFIDFGQVKYL